MSDGTINFPERITHPDTPASGRVKVYVFDDSGGTVEPYYKLDDGSENTLKGAQGDTGPTGPAGPTGPTGPTGPAGPMNTEAFIVEPGTVTLPDTSTPTIIYTDTVTISATGNHYLMVFMALKPHSTGNDMEFRIDFDGSQVGPLYAEEHKDTNAAQSVWRSALMDLGNVASGSYDLDLLFSMKRITNHHLYYLYYLYYIFSNNNLINTVIIYVLLV